MFRLKMTKDISTRQDVVLNVLCTLQYSVKHAVNHLQILQLHTELAKNISYLQTEIVVWCVMIYEGLLNF